MQTQEFVKQVGEWAKKNFADKQNPWLGMVEEVGEIAHCILKRFQGIRGFENEEFFREQLMDALGDLGIYAAHYAYKNDVLLYLGFEEPMYGTAASENQLVNELIYRLALLHDSDKEQAIQMQYSLVIRVAKTIALKYQINFHSTVLGTWEKIVYKRDWVANPESGMNDEPTSDSSNTGGIEDREPAADTSSPHRTACGE